MPLLQSIWTNFSHCKHGYFRNAVDHEALEDRDTALFIAESPVSSMKGRKEWMKSNRRKSPRLYTSCPQASRLPWWLSGKESTCQCKRCGFDPWVRKIPCRGKWQLIPAFLPGKSQGQRSLRRLWSTGLQNSWIWLSDWLNNNNNIKMNGDDYIPLYTCSYLGSKVTIPRLHN